MVFIIKDRKNILEEIKNLLVNYLEKSRLPKEKKFEIFKKIGDGLMDYNNLFISNLKEMETKSSSPLPGLRATVATELQGELKSILQDFKTTIDDLLNDFNIYVNFEFAKDEMEKLEELGIEERKKEKNRIIDMMNIEIEAFENFRKDIEATLAKMEIVYS